MAKIGTIGGANPKPETFGRRNWIGRYNWVYPGNNKQWGGSVNGENIPLNPVYSSFGVPTSVYWTEHGESYFWGPDPGDTFFTQKGVKLQMRDAAKNASYDAVFCGFYPEKGDLLEDVCAPMFPGNGTPGITGISFDWERDDERNNLDQHRMKLLKVGLVERTADFQWRFRDCSANSWKHSPPTQGGEMIFRYREPNESAHQTGHVYCPLRMDHYTNPPTAIQNNGLHNVIGVAVQWNKESGGNAASKSGAYLRVYNMAFHTKGNKEIIIPRKKVHPKFNEYPNGNYEFYTW
jgi:hypothetical protein